MYFAETAHNINPITTKINCELYINIPSVPRSKHTPPVTQTSQLMLYGEIIAVCSQIHTKHINTLCGQNAELWNAKTGGISGKHWALDGSTPLAAFISHSHRQRPSNAPRHRRHTKRPTSINDFINASPQTLPLTVVTEKLGAAVRPVKNLSNFVSAPKFHCRLYNSRYRPPLSQTNPVHNRERPF
jgi:hypothetical protein